MNKKLQVFVSSTYTDLIEERQSAVEAILSAGHIPAGMELFKAGNESQLKTIYNWINESDVFMLILGGRYGSIESTSGTSYTQLEYEYAISHNIPVFAVILSEAFLTAKINSGRLLNIMEQNEPEKYQRFKTLVMSKTIKEVNDKQDIKIVVHETLNMFMNEYDLTGWIRNYNSNDVLKLQQRNIVLANENNLLKKELEKIQERTKKSSKKSNKIAQANQLDGEKSSNSKTTNILDETDFRRIKNNLQEAFFRITLNPDEIIQKTAIQDCYTIFLNNYQILNKGVKSSIYRWQTGLLYAHVCPFLLQNKLVVKINDDLYGDIYKISDIGAAFYEIVKSK